MARLSAPAMVDRPPRSVSSFIPLKELIDLFRQLFAEHQQRAPTSLVEDALAVLFRKRFYPPCTASQSVPR